MSKIVAIGTAVPAFRHRQEDILQFMQTVYAFSEPDRRKLRYLYHHSGIDTRYSVIPDYGRPLAEWKFYPQTENLHPFPSLEQRMVWYQQHAAPLAMYAIRDCLEGHMHENEITHLITVSCTGMSAPGLDLQLLELLGLPNHVYRSSVNFMGCYAAIHALKVADAICSMHQHARVLIVCTELCTLHFQREPTVDNISASLLFGDGSAAALVTHNDHPHKGLYLDGFYSEVIPKGKKDMAWELSSSGFLMTLSQYVPELLEEDFEGMMNRALQAAGITPQDIAQWCIHPGGKRILEAVYKTLPRANGQLDSCYDVLREYGNMSSPTILFVLKRIWQSLQVKNNADAKVFAAAFGPGLTMETFVATCR